MMLAGICTAIAGVVTGTLGATTMLVTLLTGLSVGSVFKTTSDNIQYQVTGISGLTLTVFPALANTYTAQAACVLDMLPDGMFMGTVHPPMPEVQ